MRNPKMVALWKDMEDILVALNSSIFMFKWEKDEYYTCLVKYLRKTYAYVITNWKIILKKGENYTVRDDVLKQVKEDMTELWFKSKDERPQLTESIVGEINLFFDSRKDKELAPIRELDSLKNTKIAILCWLSWSWKTHYFMDNYKTPFVKFFNDKIKGSSSLIWNSWRANDSIEDFDFKKLYEDKDLTDKIDLIREKDFIRFYLYINLDYLLLESTTPWIPWENYWDKNSLSDNFIYPFKNDPNKLWVLEKILDKTFGVLKKGTDIIIDGKFTRKEEYLKIMKILNKYKDLNNIEFVYFENNKQVCLENNRVRSLKGPNWDDYKYETINDSEKVIKETTYDYLTEELKILIQKENKNKKQITFKEQKIIPAPKHPFYSLGEIRGSLPWIWKTLNLRTQVWELKKYLYSETWRGEWTYHGLDGEETWTFDADKKSEFWNLTRLIESIAKKANIKIDKNKIKDLKELNSEEIEKNLHDPYSRCETYVWRIDLDKVKEFLENEWVDFSKLDLNPKFLDEFRLSDWIF